MENASKALLIAAAVLIVILLIAFGVRVFNSTGDVSKDVITTKDYMSLKSTVGAIHLQFDEYNGNQKGSVVIEALEKAAQYNQSTGAYVAGDNTTKLKRKIAVSFPARLWGNGPKSTTGYTVIRNELIPFIDPNATYNIKCREYLDFDDDPTDEYERKQAIYLITIDIAA